MDENQTPGTEAEVPATAVPVEAAPAVVETPVAATPVAAEVPNVPAPGAVVSEPPVGVVAAVGAEAGAVVAEVAEAPSILKSELSHVFEAFEHFSLMEGISRLYALAKKHL